MSSSLLRAEGAPNFSEADDSGTVESEDAHGTAHRANQLSWARGRRGGRQRPLFETHLAKPWRTCQKQAIYAASRINQLRKSSSAASHTGKANKINHLHDRRCGEPSKRLIVNSLRLHGPHWTMSATRWFVQRSSKRAGSPSRVLKTIRLTGSPPSSILDTW